MSEIYQTYAIKLYHVASEICFSTTGSPYLSQYYKTQVTETVTQIANIQINVILLKYDFWS